MNITVSLAVSPSPSRISTVPSPYFACRTRWPFLSPAAPRDAGISIAGRGIAPGLPMPVLPPKKRAMLSIESGLPGNGGSGVSALLLFGPGSFPMGFIHEATKGFDPEAFLPPADGLKASWLSSS